MVEQPKGTYAVIFKHPKSTLDRYINGGIQFKLDTFVGECENFSTGNKCAFRNKEGQLLLVEYHDIVQMKPE